MAYTVLSRRYRSATFDDLIGQGHIGNTLKRAIETGRIAHAYLFCGTRGTGKTSTARILAKALNCRKTDGPSPEPCNACPSCLAINQGQDLDCTEIDAASNTGVDNVRELISNAQFSPAASRFRIYIIDEVHMLSKQAFNALLKTLEEPPPHVKFILATTEPEKVLPTIHSRCQRYDFRNISAREVSGHLKAICAKEGVNADDDALLLVAKAGGGSMRDSLSLLDRLLSAGETHITVALIEQLLGLPKSMVLYDFAQSLTSGNAADVLQKLDDVLTSGQSAEGFIVALVDHLRNLMLIRAAGAQSGLVEVPGISAADMATQAARYDLPTLVHAIALLEELRRSLRQGVAGRALMEAVLVRLTLAAEFTAMAHLAAGVPQADSQSGSDVKKKVVPPSLDNQPHTAIASQQADHELEEAQAIGSTADTSAPHTSGLETSASDDLPSVGKVWEGPKRSLGQIMLDAKRNGAAFASGHGTANGSGNGPSGSSTGKPAQEKAGSIAPADMDNLPTVWRHVLSHFKESAGVLHAMLSSGRLAEVSGDEAVVKLPPGSEFAISTLTSKPRTDQIAGALAQTFSRPMAIRFEIDPAQSAPPHPSPHPTPHPTSPPTSAPSPTSSAAPSTTQTHASPRPAANTAPQFLQRSASVSASHAEPAPGMAPLPTADNTLDLTPDLKEELLKHPLIAAAASQFKAQIIRASKI